ncbi:protein of unknown function [Sinosporangium album]|uniref:MrfA-like Zn-binding domain-containing protein n=1 Tax=Sinosporangium album TaxID=504805 RepID=A0A1G7RE03_9ACTN|nr:DUF1998 domain-containing protein [Sinosporangium album]SDG08409.1 protein of unknown function [Sinosporangium album]
MTTTAPYHRKVGSIRPSHLMFTGGVGALIDLPYFTVLMRGLDDWRYDYPSGSEENAGFRVVEPRLLRAARALRGQQVGELRAAPWLVESDDDPSDQAARTGVPVVPFPAWMRCIACDILAPIASATIFSFENSKRRKPHEARFFHKSCSRAQGRKAIAVPARFLLACVAGHLDEFPYAHFVHRGGACPAASYPTLEMQDRGGNIGVNVQLRCQSCNSEPRNMSEAMGRRGAENLPACRGRHPHLHNQFPRPCKAGSPPKLLVLGASNQWFAQTLSLLSVPTDADDALADKVRKHWQAIGPLKLEMYPWARTVVNGFSELARWTDEEIWAAVERHRASLEAPEEDEEGYPDLRTPEWKAFTGSDVTQTDDFSLYRPGVPTALAGFYQDVVQAERIREVRALIGFTRLDAPDPEEPDLVTSVQLAGGRPEWLPASEVRGEGVFIRVREELLAEWERRVRGSAAMNRHREAYGRFRENRFSDRIKTDFDPMKHWPGYRYYALHTLSHLLIRTIALECGYNSASLAERIYAGDETDPRGGIFIYTAVPDAEGTLGGLVTLAEEQSLIRLTRRALIEARTCSSDPLCSERIPDRVDDFLHGAACHVCLFVSETTCERGNRFLDRRFVVPVDGSGLALFPEAPVVS